MIDIKNLILIGTLRRVKNYKGFFIAEMFDEEENFIKNIENVFIKIDGYLVPFTIEDIYWTAKLTAVIKLEEINSDLDANEIKGSDIYTDKQAIAITKSYLSTDIIGFSLFNKQTGSIEGTVVDILPFDTNQQLVVKEISGYEFYLPVSLIDSISDTTRQIIAEIPDGIKVFSD